MKTYRQKLAELEPELNRLKKIKVLSDNQELSEANIREENDLLTELVQVTRVELARTNETINMMLWHLENIPLKLQDSLYLRLIPMVWQLQNNGTVAQGINDEVNEMSMYEYNSFGAVRRVAKPILMAALDELLVINNQVKLLSDRGQVDE